MRALWLLVGGLAFWAGTRRRGVQRVLRVSRVVADLGRAEAFYRDALGFSRVSAGPVPGWVPDWLGLGTLAGEEVVMRLGRQEIGLVRWAVPGVPYPSDSRSDDCWFQHLAIVVSDMDGAYARLRAAGMTPISDAGPQHLPKRNGGVTAFKFRDPDGHPLELIHFPPGQGRAVWQGRQGGPFLGIDHSALTVSDTAASLRFYGRLGFKVAARSWNFGAAQDALDGLDGARAEVTGLRPADARGPGLELLGYDPAGRPGGHAANDGVADWVTVATRGQTGPVTDPDGHMLLLVRG